MLFSLRCLTAFFRCRKFVQVPLLAGFSAILLVVTSVCVRADSPVVLEFTSAQCPACQQIDPLVQQLVAKGYPIRQVDTNAESQLAGQLGIKTLPTFVVVMHDQVIDRIEGVFDGFALERRIQTGLNNAREKQNRQTPLQSPPQAAFPQAAPIPLRQVSHIESQPISSDIAQPVMLSSASISSTSVPPTNILPTNMPSTGVSAGMVSQQMPQGTSAVDVPWLQATVRLRVESPDGHDWGTGTIIDARNGEALILTCGHIFRDSKGQGKVEVDLYCGDTSKRVPGVCLRYDADQLDLGLVKIAPPFGVDVIPVAPQGLELQNGMTLISTGCDNGDNPTIRQHQVRSLTNVAPYVGAPFSYVQTDNAPVQGRSGGGLFTETGYLVGVCVAGNTDDNEGLFVPASVIRHELESAKLACVYQSPSVTRSRISPIIQASAAVPVGSAIALADNAATRTLISNPGAALASPQISVAIPTAIVQPVYVPANDTAIITQPSFVANDQATVAPRPLAIAQTSYQETTLTNRERATLEEVQRRQNAGDEVIIIVRSKQKPDEPCEVIQLSDVSPEFLNALTQQNAGR